MQAIIKTLPSMFAQGRIEEFFDGRFCQYFFTLGRGKPSRTIHQIFFTHSGRILGNLEIVEVVQNTGQLPKLTTLDGDPSAWQIRPDRWVAICKPPFRFLEETLYHEGFRGWRYFDLASYRNSLDAKVAI